MKSHVHDVMCVCDVNSSLTSHMQVQGARVRSQAIFCDGGNPENSCAMVHMPDTLLRPAKVRVGHCCSISKVQLDIRPYRVSLWTMHTMFNLQCLISMCALTRGPARSRVYTRLEGCYRIVKKIFWLIQAKSI